MLWNQLAGIHQKAFLKMVFLQQQKIIHTLYIDALMKAHLRIHVVSSCL